MSEQYGLDEAERALLAPFFSYKPYVARGLLTVNNGGCVKDPRFVITDDLAQIVQAPEGALIVLSIPKPFWESARVPEELRVFDWRAVRGQVSLCFHGIDDDPREVFEFPEIRAFVLDAIASTPELIRKMADEREWPPGLFGKWSFLAVASKEDPMDLTKFSDNPPETFARVFIEDGFARVVPVSVN